MSNGYNDKNNDDSNFSYAVYMRHSRYEGQMAQLGKGYQNWIDEDKKEYCYVPQNMTEQETKVSQLKIRQQKLITVMIKITWKSKINLESLQFPLLWGAHNLHCMYK